MAIEKRAFVAFLVWITCVYLILFVSLVYAQASDPISALFFDSCKECIPIDRPGLEYKNEYGYKIDHGSWSEEHVWYGASKEEAVANFAKDVSQ